jgi:antirestriction protein
MLYETDACGVTQEWLLNVLVKNGYCHELDEAIEVLEDNYHGEYEGRQGLREFSDQLANDMMPNAAPEFLINYFDYEYFCRDLFRSDYFYIEELRKNAFDIEIPVYHIFHQF